MAGVSLDDQLKEARREVALRRHFYPQWVRGGRLTQDAADKQLAAMEAIRDTLVDLVRKANPQGGLDL